MDDDPASLNVKRHYLRIRDDVDVDPKLRAYCNHANFHSYPAADAARKKKLEEYGVADPTAVEVGFRR